MIENFLESSKYAQELFEIGDEIVEKIERESLEDKVPIITRDVLNFMIYNANNINAKNIINSKNRKNTSKTDEKAKITVFCLAAAREIKINKGEV